MELLIGERQSGKTTKAISLSAEKGAYLVVASRAEAIHIVREAKRNGLDIPFPLTFDEFITGRFYGKRIPGFIIENIDILIQHLARGVPILMATLTKETP